MRERGFMDDFKRFFGRGLAILLPSILTLWILFQLGLFVFKNVAAPINAGIQSVVLFTLPRVITDEDRLPDFARVSEEELSREIRRRDLLEEELTPARLDAIEDGIRHAKYQEIWDERWYLKGVGLVVAIVAIYLAGLLLGNYLGKSIYTRLEGLIARVPGFKQIYPHVKQLVDMIFGEDKSKKAFNEVVLIEYPGEGCWTVGLVTGKSFQMVRDEVDEEMISVLIPTSPTPMTGFVINVRRADAKTLDMTVDQAIRFVVTAGVLTPDSKNGDQGAAKAAATPSAGIGGPPAAG